MLRDSHRPARDEAELARRLLLQARGDERRRRKAPALLAFDAVDHPARIAQASDQLVEKTKGLEATQQESIDQLQVVQDQLQTVRRLLASQQTDTKKLSEQVGRLTEAIDGLRQSFASTRASEAAADSAPRKRSAKAKPRSSQKR